MTAPQFPTPPALPLAAGGAGQTPTSPTPHGGVGPTPALDSTPGAGKPTTAEVERTAFRRAPGLPRRSWALVGGLGRFVREYGLVALLAVAVPAALGLAFALVAARRGVAW